MARISRPPLHMQIIIGLVLGLIWGLFAGTMGLNQFTIDWIKPFGTIFVNLLKLIAVPLILSSLISGITGLKDVSQLSRMGGRAIFIYLCTTVIAVTIGLFAVNTFKPGSYLSQEKRQELKEQFSDKAVESSKTAKLVTERGPLQPLVDMVSENLFQTLSANRNMLQAVFFAVFFGICLILIPQEKAKPVKEFFEGANAVVLKMVEIIMKMAPIGVFALLASLIAEFAGDDPASALELLKVLSYYSLTVVGALAVMALVIYPAIVVLLSRKQYPEFLRGIFKAQMLAFSTSSSSATLPVTMDCVENNLGVREEVSSFVLPLGATINMDGTSLYQAVATVFIAQAFAHDLTLGNQISIVMTATLASIGSAGVPGAGMVMLVIVLNSVGIDPAGLALVVAVDRILDMCRTTVNVTGDSAVSVLVNAFEGKNLDKKAPEKAVSAS